MQSGADPGLFRCQLHSANSWAHLLTFTAPLSVPFLLQRARFHLDETTRWPRLRSRMLRDQSSNLVSVIFPPLFRSWLTLAVDSIVFVHGLRGNGSASWCKATAPSATVESLLQQVPGIRVREYDGKKELHEEFDWESFLDIEASSLLKFLDQENSPDVRPGHMVHVPMYSPCGADLELPFSHFRGIVRSFSSDTAWAGTS